jgi:uncharacterized protein YecT (DUF1311 family)
MTRIIPSLASILFLAAFPVMAQEEEDGSAAHLAAVKSCLAIASAKQEAAMAVDEETEDEEADPSPEHYFTAQAAARARETGYALENCIGVVAGPCAAEAGYSLMAEHSCAGLELEIWERLLNAAYRGKLKLPPADPASEETPEEEAAKPRAAEPAPDCQPVNCEISVHDNLRKTQLAFAAWREAMCDQNYIESGGGRENQIDITRCHMNLTAQQYFWLEYGQGFER